MMFIKITLNIRIIRIIIILIIKSSTYLHIDFQKTN